MENEKIRIIEAPDHVYKLDIDAKELTEWTVKELKEYVDAVLKADRGDLSKMDADQLLHYINNSGASDEEIKEAYKYLKRCFFVPKENKDEV